MTKNALLYICRERERERERTGVKAEATTKRGGAKNNASKYVIVSLDPVDYLPGLVVKSCSNRQISYSGVNRA